MAVRDDVFVKLVERYPHFFSLSYPALPEGWIVLLEDTCQKIEERLGSGRSEGFCFTGIKEKYGSLRLDYSLKPGTEAEGDYRWLDAQMDSVEGKSEETCSVCGQPGTLQTDIGWFAPLCKAHYALRKGARK